MTKTKDLSKFTVNTRREKFQPSKKNSSLHKMYYPSKKTYSANSSSLPQEEDSFYPPKMENPPKFLLLQSPTKNGIPEEFLLRRAPLLLLKWSTPFFHQKRMVLLISSSCGESSSFPPFVENSPKEELHRNSFSRRDNHMTWLWGRSTGDSTASFRKSSDKTTCIFIHELYNNDD